MKQIALILSIIAFILGAGLSAESATMTELIPGKTIHMKSFNGSIKSVGYSRRIDVFLKRKDISIVQVQQSSRDGGFGYLTIWFYKTENKKPRNRQESLLEELIRQVKKMSKVKDKKRYIDNAIESLKQQCDTGDSF